MRPSILLLSLILHAAAIGAAAGLGAHAGQRPAAEPRAEVQIRIASPAATAEPVPEVRVVVERSMPAEPLYEDPLPVEPLPVEPLPGFEAPRPETSLPPPAPQPSLQRFRKLPRPELVEASVASVPQASVDASPLADNEPPAYPDHERRHGLEGTVVLLVAVDERGNVIRVGLKSPSAHPGLNREALRAVRRWRFEPALRDGRAVAGETDVVIQFRIDG